MASILSFLKIFGFILLPALVSINSITILNQQSSESWLKYWIVISFTIPLDMITNKWKGWKLEMLKAVFIMWCLAPIEDNGSDVVFNKILCPIYKIVDKVMLDVAIKSSPYIKQCVKLTKADEIPETVEIYLSRVKECLLLGSEKLKQLLELMVSKILQQDIKPRLFSDIYKDIKNWLFT